MPRPKVNRSNKVKDEIQFATDQNFVSITPLQIMYSRRCNVRGP